MLLFPALEAGFRAGLVFAEPPDRFGHWLVLATGAAVLPTAGQLLVDVLPTAGQSLLRSVFGPAPAPAFQAAGVPEAARPAHELFCGDTFLRLPAVSACILRILSSSI